MDAGGDELFKLTTKEGKLTVETEQVNPMATLSAVESSHKGEPLQPVSGTAQIVTLMLQVAADVGDLDSGLIFEQDPAQIIDALLPLYLNSTLLRSLQVQIHLCAWRSVWL